MIKLKSKTVYLIFKCHKFKYISNSCSTYSNLYTPLSTITLWFQGTGRGPEGVACPTRYYMSTWTMCTKHKRTVALHVSKDNVYQTQTAVLHVSKDNVYQTQTDCGTTCQQGQCVPNTDRGTTCQQGQCVPNTNGLWHYMSARTMCTKHRPRCYFINVHGIACIKPTNEGYI